MKENILIQSDWDNLPLDVMIMRPANPKGIIQFSHGMCEHKERYYNFMEYLCQNGYVCIIHDHRGHGKSVYRNDDLGFFYENGSQAIVEDLHQLTLFIKQQYPQLPLYLFGHSMGSLVVRCYLKNYDYEINGLFVCGSPSRNSASKIGILLAKAMNKIKHDHYRSSLIKKIAFGTFNRNFEAIENSWICSNKEVVETYNNDLLCHFTFTANGFEVLFQLMQQTYSTKDWQVKNPNLTIHFIAGSLDPCIQSEKKFMEAVTFLKARGYHQITSKLFQNMRHEILNEKNNTEVYHHILSQIKSWE